MAIGGGSQVRLGMVVRASSTPGPPIVGFLSSTTSLVGYLGGKIRPITPHSRLGPFVDTLTVRRLQKVERRRIATRLPNIENET